jgi:hypothetical protein
MPVNRSAINAERGTTFLSVERFLDKLEHQPPGQSFVYATGDLSVTAQRDPQAFALRKAAWQMYEAKKIQLTQRINRERSFVCGGRAFDYIATRCREDRPAAEDRAR